MTASDSLTPAYFDHVYAAKADPWNFETSAYERKKYAATMAALPQARFESGFEIGCSIGVLTGLLASRCSRLLAVDVSEAALSAARIRLSQQPHVSLQAMHLPQEFPAGDFDLVVLSEVGYYWSVLDLELARKRIVGTLRPGGALVLVHWTPAVHDYPLTGDEVHERFTALCNGDAPLLRHVAGQSATTYRLDVLERTGASTSP